MSGDKLKALGWRPRIGLRQGVADAYRAFLAESAGNANAARRSGRSCQDQP
jgi:hypothetical protein